MEFSIIFSFVERFLSKILSCTKLSFVYILIQRSFDLFKNIIRESVALKIVYRIRLFFAVLLSGSAVLKSFQKNDRISGTCEESLLIKVCSIIINLPIVLARWVFGKISMAFDNSSIFKVVKFVFDKLYALIGLLVLLTLIVPDQKWYNVYTLGIVGLIVAMYIVKAGVVPSRTFKLTQIDPIMMLFFAVLFLSAVFSLSFSQSLRFVVFYLVSIMMIISIVSEIECKRKFESFLWIFMFGVFLSSVYGSWQVATNSVPFDPSLTDVENNQGLPGRVFSTMANPNNYAELLVLSFPWIVALIMNAKMYVQKIIGLLFLICVTAVMLYTGSRSGWLGLLFAIGMFVLLKKPKWIPTILLAGVLSVPLWPEFVVRRFSTLFSFSLDSSSMYRVKIFNTVLPIIQDYWMYGIGLGTDIFTTITGNYYLLTNGIPAHTHILYSQILLETGILGLIMFVWFIGRVFKQGIILVKQNSTNRNANYVIAGISALAGLLLIGLVEYIWYYPRIQFYFWINIGLIYAVMSIIKTEKRAGG